MNNKGSTVTINHNFHPKVSVMIITYNQEELIAETIDSVLAQNYENIEIIVSDDASTDQTAQIIKQYADRYPEKVIPVLNPNNLGITGNSNAAFFACTGELIAVLGGDDLFLPHKIAEQVKLFQNPEVVLSYHAVEIFQHQTNEVLFTTNTTRNEDTNNVYEIVAKGGIPGASSVMVRKSACPIHGFDPTFPTVSDWIFYIEVAMRGRVAKLDGIYGRYRKHGKGASEQTFNLLSESLRTLDVIQSRYPADADLKIACEKGAYRYLLGELFRQIIKGNQEKVNLVVQMMIRRSSGFKQWLTVMFSYFCKSKLFISSTGFFFNRLKQNLKKIV